MSIAIAPQTTPAVSASGNTNDSDNKRTSLLDLPPEIWSNIGKLVIDDHPKPDGFFNPYRSQGRPHQPSITRVCRALREELLPYFYRIWGPHYAHEWNDKKMGRWLRAIGRENRRHVRGVWFIVTEDSASQEMKALRRKWKVEFEVRVDEERTSKSTVAGRIFYDVVFT